MLLRAIPTVAFQGIYSDIYSRSMIVQIYHRFSGCRRKKEAEATLIKSRDPKLAAGEKWYAQVSKWMHMIKEMPRLDCMHNLSMLQICTAVKIIRFYQKEAPKLVCIMSCARFWSDCHAMSRICSKPVTLRESSRESPLEHLRIILISTLPATIFQH